MKDRWASAILVNESSRADLPGDITLFHSPSAAESKLEAVDVRNGEYFAFTLAGRRLNLSLDGGMVKIRAAQDDSDYTKTVRQLLEVIGYRVLDARRRESKEQSLDVSILSTDGLVELIGFYNRE
ncbi:hypothetical protein FRZ44_35420 [Hypericibacter terrae]|uniref:Uncharacterized protein n=1 Tax=Hypericibacter terrae TaxID=2602015 RepID=A0A5J6MM63_9PROT|nr:hypothetical protein [Hypericibacter terrae]QEX18237.1 hypothetical protein FRZ44_35420 [Hypericibacter terrae]